MKRILIAALSIGLVVTQAPAKDRMANVIDTWIKSHLQCRGGSGDDPATQEACVVRDHYTEVLIEEGFCWRRDLANRWAKCRDGEVNNGPQ